MADLNLSDLALQFDVLSLGNRNGGEEREVVNKGVDEDQGDQTLPPPPSIPSPSALKDTVPVDNNEEVKEKEIEVADKELMPPPPFLPQMRMKGTEKEEKEEDEEGGTANANMSKEGDEDDVWTDATDFVSSEDSAQWDLLLTKGAGLKPKVDLTRDSLFVKFDPLLQKPDPPPAEDLDMTLMGPPPPPSKTRCVTVSASGLLQQLELGLRNSEIKQEEEEEDNEEEEEDTTMMVPQEADPIAVSQSHEQGATGEWVNATELSEAQDPIQWDMLLNRGSGMQLQHSKNLTVRDSIFMKFDPLHQRQTEDTRKQFVEEQENENEVEAAKENIEPGLKTFENIHVEDSAQALIPQLEERIRDNEEEAVIGEEKALAVEEVQEDPEELAIREVQAKIEQKVRAFEELQAKYQKNLQEIEKIRKHRDDVKQDLNDMESGFAEVLICYESGKVYQRNFENNQKVLDARNNWLLGATERRDSQLQYIEEKEEEIMQMVKKEAEDKLKIVSHENLKLKAHIKVGEYKMHKLENDIAKMDVQSKQLQKLCDEIVQI